MSCIPVGGKGDLSVGSTACLETLYQKQTRGQFEKLGLFRGTGL